MLGVTLTWYTLQQWRLVMPNKCISKFGSSRLVASTVGFTADKVQIGCAEEHHCSAESFLVSSPKDSSEKR